MSRAAVAAAAVAAAARHASAAASQPDAALADAHDRVLEQSGVRAALAPLTTTHSAEHYRTLPTAAERQAFWAVAFERYCRWLRGAEPNAASPYDGTAGPLADARAAREAAGGDDTAAPGAIARGGVTDAFLTPVMRVVLFDTFGLTPRAGGACFDALDVTQTLVTMPPPPPTHTCDECGATYPTGSTVVCLKCGSLLPLRASSPSREPYDTELTALHVTCLSPWTAAVALAILQAVPPAMDPVTGAPSDADVASARSAVLRRTPLYTLLQTPHHLDPRDMRIARLAVALVARMSVAALNTVYNSAPARDVLQVNPPLIVVAAHYHVQTHKKRPSAGSAAQVQHRHALTHALLHALLERVAPDGDARYGLDLTPALWLTCALHNYGYPDDATAIVLIRTVGHQCAAYRTAARHAIPAALAGVTPLPTALHALVNAYAIYQPQDLPPAFGGATAADAIS